MAVSTDFSTSNILNSLSLYLAGRALSAGLLLYWQASDALQISTNGWYFQFSTNRSTILADPTVDAALDSCKGVLTVMEAFPAEPRFVQRLISESVPGDQHQVALPAVAIDVDAVAQFEPYELGTKVKYRWRPVMIEFAVRNAHEQRWVADRMESWFEPDTVIPIANHDDGSLVVVGDVNVIRPRVEIGTYLDMSEVLTFQIVAGMWVIYVV